MANFVSIKLYPVLDSIPLWITKHASPDVYLILKNQDNLLQQAIKLDKQRDNPTMKESGRPSMMEAFMNSPSLPESEKRPERIKAEAQIAIGAYVREAVLKLSTHVRQGNLDHDPRTESSHLSHPREPRRPRSAHE